MDALGGRHQLVVEGGRDLAGGRHPADPLLADGLAPAVAVDHPGLVVVVPGLGASSGHAPGRRRSSRAGRRRRTRSVSAARFRRLGANHRLAYHRRIDSRTCGLADRERQQALGVDDVARVLVGHHRRRAAELAALRHAGGLEERDRLAALALHRRAIAIPAAGAVGNRAQRQREVVLLDEGAVARPAPPATPCRSTGTPAPACRRPSAPRRRRRGSGACRTLRPRWRSRFGRQRRRATGNRRRLTFGH